MYEHGITCHHAGLGAAAVPATLSVCVHEPEPQLERASPLIARSASPYLVIQFRTINTPYNTPC